MPHPRPTDGSRRRATWPHRGRRAGGAGLAAVVVVGLVTAGCSGGSDAPPNPQAATTAAVTVRPGPDEAFCRQFDTRHRQRDEKLAAIGGNGSADIAESMQAASAAQMEFYRSLTDVPEAIRPQIEALLAFETAKAKQGIVSDAELGARAGKARGAVVAWLASACGLTYTETQL